MNYSHLNNIEILNILKLKGNKGWFPVNESVKVFNISQDKDIELLEKSSTKLITGDWKIDALVAIYPNHSYFNYKDKIILVKKPNPFSSKINIIPDQYVKRESNQEELSIQNFYLDLAVRTAKYEQNIYPVYTPIPFNIFIKLNTMGILTTDVKLAKEKLDENNLMEKMTVYLKDENFENDDEFLQYLNKVYRIVGIHVVNITTAYSSPLSEDEKKYLKPEDKNKINPVYSIQQTNVRDEVDKNLIKEKEKAINIFEKAKSTIENIERNYILDKSVELNIEKFIHELNDSELKHMKINFLKHIADVYSKTKKENETFEEAEKRRNRIIGFNLNDIVENYENLNLEWIYFIIRKIKNLFEISHIPLTQSIIYESEKMERIKYCSFVTDLRKLIKDGKNLSIEEIINKLKNNEISNRAFFKNNEDTLFHLYNYENLLDIFRNEQFYIDKKTFILPISSILKGLLSKDLSRDFIINNNLLEFRSLLCASNMDNFYIYLDEKDDYLHFKKKETISTPYSTLFK